MKNSLIERRKMRRLINEYSKLGYTIYADFKDLKKPNPIGDFIPDIVAVKDDNKVIMEIITREKTPEVKEKISYLSKFAENNKDYRFDLIYTNPRTYQPKGSKEITSENLLYQTHKKLLNEASSQFRQENYLISLTILNILLDGLLRKLATKKNIKFYINDTVQNMYLKLYDEKVISKENKNLIERMLNIRNIYIHSNKKIKKQDINSYLEFVSNFFDYFER